MSRTDKDTPYWTRAEWFEPYHTCRQHHSRWWQKWHDVCDLPPEPAPTRPCFAPRFSIGHPQPPHCSWVEIWDYANRFPRGAGNGPPKWFRSHVWHNLSRTRQRRELTLARKEWTGSGDTDVVPNIDQHRHRASWLWH